MADVNILERGAYYVDLIRNRRVTADEYLGLAHRNLLAGRIAEAIEQVRMAGYYVLAQNDLQYAWTQEIVHYFLHVPPGGAPTLTDAQIFDACYRELVKRWT